MNTSSLSKLAFYSTAPHSCSYLPGQESITLFADPDADLNTQVYAQLIDYGFRRSGGNIYRPQCARCSACIPVRIPAASFKPNRRQRRNRVKNQDIEITPTNSEFKQEHFDLYQHYISARHKGGGMDDPSPEKYIEFLTSHWVDTRFYEFRHHGRLLAVAVADVIPQGLSSVYTFYEPNEAKRGLGIFSVLWEIQETVRLGLEWLYLGYWIEECPKMSYKIDYQPAEAYINSQWVTKTL